ncbi:MAG: ECF transporter S component, partial [Clostridia bacterium]|nr:ECF transporter S component [Clostridia bacterium]
GPLSGIVITIIKDLIHLIIKGAGATGGIGDLADFFTCLCFILPSGLIYKKFPSFKGMTVGLITGCISSALLSGLVFNALVVYPLYDKFILPMTAIIGMYQQIRPSANGLWEILAIFNMPYTFLKCVVISIIAVIIAKPLSSLLKINRDTKQYT